MGSIMENRTDKHMDKSNILGKQDGFGKGSHGSQPCWSSLKKSISMWV